MAVLSRRYYLIKLVNRAIPVLIFIFVIATSLYAHGINGDQPTPNEANTQPITDTQTDKTPPADIPSKKIATFDLENGFERFFFYTKYQIGGKTKSLEGAYNYYFPISELKFPLNAYMFYGNLDFTILDRLTIHYNVRKNINNRVGKMEDSDWVPYSGIKTIYSESDARLNAIFTEADLIVRLFTVSFFSLKMGAGFTHQYMYYWCSNTKQESILNVSDNIIMFGRSIIYKINYYMFTLQLAPVFTIPIGKGKLEIITAIRFSPYINARDIDDHLIRGKLSKGNSAGAGVMPFLKIRYTFSTKIFITAKLDYLYLKTEGHQSQYYYFNPNSAQSWDNIPGWNAKLQNRLISEQLSVSLGAGYSFEI